MLDRDAVEEVIQRVANLLEGDWVVIGGSALALWLAPGRSTEDVDIFGVEGTQGQRFGLMQVAEDLGLPVESVNSAADFFVKRIDGWERELVLLFEGKRGRVYRPSATLFLLLKVGRMSERDLADCKIVVEHESIDAERVIRALDALESDDVGVVDRRNILRQLLAP